MKDFNFQNIIMNKINSYTYLIGWSTLNKYYYGVRTAKNCNPKELFVSYFTSSKYVKKFIKQFGNPDIIQIRKTFNDKLKALEWEEKVINRLNMVFRDDFLNCGNGGKLFNSIGRTTVINKKTGEQYSISCEDDLSIIEEWKICPISCDVKYCSVVIGAPEGTSLYTSLLLNPVDVV